MIRMTLAEIAEVVGGAAHGDATVTGPAFFDSRAVEPGGLFLAVEGERVDGHDYAVGAVAAGAAAVLGSRPTDVPTVVVDDPVAALGLLARHVRDRLSDLTVLALTGSQGKTGTKDYLAQVLGTAGETVATTGNLNNEIGVPVTVLRAGPTTRYLVVEMGARGVGHIAYLCGIARPTVAGVLNVGTAHLGEFGSREAIARAKGEILEELPADGVAVLNADDDLVAPMAGRTAARALTFGRAAGSDVTWHDATYDDLGRPTATFGHAGHEAEVALRQAGEHQLANAGAAAAFAVAAGLGLDDVAGALREAVSLSRWRMEITDLPDGVVVVNDAYNANPASMGAAVDTLARIGERRRTTGGRTIAVLGEMKELGDTHDEAHREVGEVVARAGIDRLLVVGEPAAAMAAGAASVTDWPGTAIRVAGRDEALAWLRENIAAGDVVLVKASRGAALELVVQGLTEIPEERA
ncbi:UDP-N-acetylmuramoyl-tripeptide--D-alanyl-D-alanine ligase [Nocardioides guangzhouensis]|uniref:UDP-N-acetylmuramoyl-tripeptide--D-alanyl-D-alanine ligase n=1 Tax=Nocardioides guangzhouensis TaxID=2497878 RepID=A0A4Q4Z6I5_9ACTN|nr:UDP-N-acetylmuramoyl-tripeptide--D-alanyl-D-alanine ligase [Nocardioides guangzhouensis]RYP83343.1 UDP-N-acetylmuramoyl-tripeptide--D-alanyl-D-alanine ligase [Nocardioides guangzhouensis]